MELRDKNMNQTSEGMDKGKNGKLKVLIVDDEVYIRDLLAKLVKAYAHDSDTAADGIEALEKLSNHRYDVMVTDIKMPRMDGFTLLKNTKQGYPGTAVVVMTGYSQDYSVREALVLGAEEYISKPFQSEEIIMVIERAFLRNQAKRVNLNCT